MNDLRKEFATWLAMEFGVIDCPGMEIYDIAFFSYLAGRKKIISEVTNEQILCAAEKYTHLYRKGDCLLFSGFHECVDVSREVIAVVRGILDDLSKPRFNE